jgi:hypothetical protein
VADQLLSQSQPGTKMLAFQTLEVHLWQSAPREARNIGKTSRIIDVGFISPNR